MAILKHTHTHAHRERERQTETERERCIPLSSLPSVMQCRRSLMQSCWLCTVTWYTGSTTALEIPCCYINIKHWTFPTLPGRIIAINVENTYILDRQGFVSVVKGLDIHSTNLGPIPAGTQGGICRGRGRRVLFTKFRGTALDGYVVRQFTCPKAVTHPSVIRSQCRATSHPGQLSLAIPPWLVAMSTGAGYNHR